MELEGNKKIKYYTAIGIGRFKIVSFVKEKPYLALIEPDLDKNFQKIE